MPPKQLSLAELQARLFGLITARGSVPDELQAQSLAATHVTDHLEGDHRLDAVGRLDIYNSMYFLRLCEDVLEADYLTVKAVLGDEAFTKMIGDYLAECPSRKPSARYASESLPGFLAAWSVRNHAPVWLSELATLEWARVDTFDDVDDPVMAAADLQGMDPSALPALHLQTVRAHRTVTASYDIADVWRSVENGDAPRTPKDEANTLLVWREDAMVYHRQLTSDEVALWGKLARGMSFGELCEHLGETYDDAAAAQTAVQLLTSWLGDGLLVATGAGQPTQPPPSA